MLDVQTTARQDGKNLSADAQKARISRLLHSLIFTGLLGVSAVAGAADLPDSHDLDILPRFLRSEIVDFNQAAGQERIYPQGSISRIRP